MDTVSAQALILRQYSGMEESVQRFWKSPWSRRSFDAYSLIHPYATHYLFGRLNFLRSTIITIIFDGEKWWFCTGTFGQGRLWIDWRTHRTVEMQNTSKWRSMHLLEYVWSEIWISSIIFLNEWPASDNWNDSAWISSNMHIASMDIRVWINILINNHVLYGFQLQRNTGHPGCTSHVVTGDLKMWWDAIIVHILCIFVRLSNDKWLLLLTRKCKKNSFMLHNMIFL